MPARTSARRSRRRHRSTPERHPPQQAARQSWARIAAGLRRAGPIRRGADQLPDRHGARYQGGAGPRPDRGPRPADSGTRRAPLHDAPQAGRLPHHAARSGGAAHRARSDPAGPSHVPGRSARRRHQRTPPPDERRRDRAPPHASALRGDEGLPSGGERRARREDAPPHASRTRAGTRRNQRAGRRARGGRARGTRGDRGEDPRGPLPAGAAHVRDGRARGSSPPPHPLWTAPSGQAAEGGMPAAQHDRDSSPQGRCRSSRRPATRRRAAARAVGPQLPAAARGTAALDEGAASRRSQPALASHGGEAAVTTPRGETAVAAPWREAALASPGGEAAVTTPKRQTAVAAPWRETAFATPRRETGVPTPRGKTAVAPPRRETTVPAPGRETAVAPSRESSCGSKPKASWVPRRIEGFSAGGEGSCTAHGSKRTQAQNTLTLLAIGRPSKLVL